MGADQTVSPVFIQKNMRHKNIQSTLNYIRPSLGQALRANDILCGNDAGDGWDTRFTSNKRSLQPHLPQTCIKPVSQTPPNVATGKEACHSGLAKVRKTAQDDPKPSLANPGSLFDPARYRPSAAPSTAVSGGSRAVSSRTSEILGELRARGITVETRRAPVLKGAVQKPSVPRVKTRKSALTRTKSHNPHPNLQDAKKRLSGCPVSVSLSQSVSEDPQVFEQVIIPQPGQVPHQSQPVDQLTLEILGKYAPHSECLTWGRNPEEASADPANSWGGSGTW